MRRALPIAVLAAAAAAIASPAAGAERLPAKVKLTACSNEAHEAEFYGRMRQLPGTSRMAMRFTLFEESGGDRPRRVKAKGLQRWHRSKAGVHAFGYRQAFRNLPENASHRVRVDFRWYSADGRELGRATRRSARCRQFEALPNLSAEITAVMPTGVAGVFRYQALVRNTGRAAATAVPVRLTVDGDVVDTVTLASLGAGEKRSLVIRGPGCKRLAQLEADPEQAIAEGSEADNADELDCAALRNAG
jgi:CARDB